jgi:translation initiation factor IF-2
MNDAVPERIPQTQPAFSGRPPGAPEITARNLEDWPPEDPGKAILLPDFVVVRDLASAIGVKPFKIVADLLALEQFKNADEEVDFATASIIARKHGCRAERPPPGVLVLY